jgi:hypothetical protein
MGRYIVGIDLGTTNCALAYVDLKQKAKEGRPEIHPFAISQLVAAGEVASRELLPSFVYLPGEHDLPPGAAALAWDAKRNYIVGEFARNHGVRVPGRLVSSAKSWLCHAGVDRSAALLPWAAPPDVPRLSPVEVSARYVQHLSECWNFHMARSAPEDTLERQAVVLTVPASFDDVARNLTVEAARKAGLDNVTLLEEPQAAFYCWLATHSQSETSRLRPGTACLVVDVGGGTSDFSLIRATEQDGELGFIREAVGDHLLLGGDNMDLALAKLVETRLSGAGRLDAAQYAMLTQVCRNAKEHLLGDHPPASYAVTVMGRGRQVIGGSLRAALSPADVRAVIFDGFLPLVPKDAQTARSSRSGLHEMGLPYVDDPAITRHLAGFLKRHLWDGAKVAMPADIPGAILFNGGVFQPQALQDRVLEVLHSWFDRPGHSWQSLVLKNPSLDLAVAWGAAHYGWLRHTGGKRIGGGSARSYYVGIDAADTGVAAPDDVLSVLCVVPQHLEEGQEVLLTKPELELALGQPVLFPLFTSTVRADDRAGDLLHAAPGQLLRMPPLHTVLRGGKRSGSKRVPVTLAARSTEVGTLELWCAAREGGNRWRLEFNIRDIVQEPAEDPESAGHSPQAVTDVWPETQVQEAARIIGTIYGQGSEARGHDPAPSTPAPRELTRALERALDTARAQWPAGLCRRLWEFLRDVAEQRKRSPEHLARWYHLVGYCLRPGFGDTLDRYRVEQLWKLMHAPKSDRSSSGSLKSPEGGSDFWIMWRRAAGGLGASLQQSLFDRLRPNLLPSRGRSAPKPQANELAEMWRTAASLERLDIKHKEQLGQTLLKSVRRSPAPTFGFWSLTRLGARSLLYGPLNAVVHPDTAERWLDAILEFQPGHESEGQSWAFCLAQLARRTGQRALDINDAHRERVLGKLQHLEIPSGWPRMVAEVTEHELEEESQMFGEALPIGLRLSTAISDEAKK